MFRDAKQVPDTYLFNLSKQPGVSWFRNIALVSSYQDSYSPYNSSRIQINQKALKDPELGRDYISMASNILTGLRTDIVHRIDVNFKIKEK